ncbi:hypothetical protein [Nonomuraea wenchangensis]|uniref:Uncharacterized protein n=1 Tax=Nonomuraea wenchangensis TaxID=568860 RepID=A0A1I0LTL8_9ACTN|nr:hypothetical protein [Nonomuraea wenchangensis]SEU46503.1 hypothetical protein SAMN05421811_12757 [Nonomuraea wenchangensis]
MAEATATAPFAYSSLYIDTDGSYFDVIDALPDAPVGSVIVNVSGLLLGLEPHDLNLLFGMLGPNAVHGQRTLPLKDPDGDVWLTAVSDQHGLDLTVSFPACGSNARVVLPHDQADRVRAAVKEVTEGA